MFYEPSDGHGLPHDPLKAIIAPRPIGWISTRNRAGVVNLAPYSFFNMVASAPPLVMFSSEPEKDSASFARDSGEFVANLVGFDLAAQMNATSVNAPRGVDEFDYAGLTQAPCRLVSAPRVGEALASLECKVTEIIRPRGVDGRESEATMIVGQIVGVHIDEAAMTDGLFDIRKAGNVARLGYMDFSHVAETFVMRRPRWKQD